MRIKKFYALLATEVTIKNTVADFAMIIVDSKGIIVNSCSVLVRDHYKIYPLFNRYSDEIGTGAKLKEKEHTYKEFLNSGRRMLASTSAINNWLQLGYCKYHPELVAINLPSVVTSCQNTGIDLGNFVDKFSLGQAALGNICKTRAFQKFYAKELCTDFTLSNDLTSRTFAHLVASFISGGEKEEKLTAYEYLMDFDLPIFINVLNRKNWRSKIVPEIKELADVTTIEKPAQKLIAKGTAAEVNEPAQALPEQNSKSAKTTTRRKERSPRSLAKDPTTGPERLESLAGTSEAVDRLLVKHPNASADLLANLSRLFDPRICQQVAIHANTPKDVLLRLAHIFPEDIIRNPVFDRLFLEESERLLSQIGSRLATILGRPDCPLCLMDWVVRHGTRHDRSVVAKNPIVPVELLNYLAANDDEIGLTGPISLDQAKAILLAEIKRRIKSDASINSYRYEYKRHAWMSSEHPFGVQQAILFKESDARSLVLEILNIDFERMIARCDAELLGDIVDDVNWNTDKIVIPALVNHPALTNEMLIKILGERIGWPGDGDNVGELHEECALAVLAHPACPVKYQEENN